MLFKADELSIGAVRSPDGATRWPPAAAQWSFAVASVALPASLRSLDAPPRVAIYSYYSLGADLAGCSCHRLCR